MYLSLDENPQSDALKPKGNQLTQARKTPWDIHHSWTIYSHSLRFHSTTAQTGLVGQ